MLIGLIIMRNKFKLGVSGLFFVILIIASSTSPVLAQEQGELVLENGRVNPDNGVWGENFTFKVTYINKENRLPSENHPKIYISETPSIMSENNPNDKNTINGKLYEFTWTPNEENVDNHEFYFYVEDNQGENYRLPENDSYEGPIVRKRRVSLNYNVGDFDLAPGEEAVFTGSLRTARENEVMVGENIILYEIFSDNSTKLKSTVTNENGEFSLTLNVSEKGIGAYSLRFPGSGSYEENKSSFSYVNSLDKLPIFSGSAAIILVLVLVLLFVLFWGIPKEYLIKPLLIAPPVGVALLFMPFINLGFFISLLVAGGLAGYLFSKWSDKWINQLRVGVMAGVLLSLANGLLVAYALIIRTDFLTFLGLRYSVSQAEVFGLIFQQTLYYFLIFGLLAGIGGLLGGMLRTTKPKNKNN
ncbi:MAG: hypothetical protein KGY45_00455 [Hadesarchaea archaeon]|nr:hypothetical protein [Hadesarchaea archaeon]